MMLQYRFGQTFLLKFVRGDFKRDYKNFSLKGVAICLTSTEVMYPAKVGELFIFIFLGVHNLF